MYSQICFKFRNSRDYHSYADLLPLLSNIGGLDFKGIHL